MEGQSEPNIDKRTTNGQATSRKRDKEVEEDEFDYLLKHRMDGKSSGNEEMSFELIKAWVKMKG